jgi:hypothetical protein
MMGYFTPRNSEPLFQSFSEMFIIAPPGGKKNALHGYQTLKRQERPPAVFLSNNFIKGGLFCQFWTPLLGGRRCVKLPPVSWALPAFWAPILERRISGDAESRLPLTRAPVSLQPASRVPLLTCHNSRAGKSCAGPLPLCCRYQSDENQP